MVEAGIYDKAHITNLHDANPDTLKTLNAGGFVFVTIGGQHAIAREEIWPYPLPNVWYEFCFGLTEENRTYVIGELRRRGVHFELMTYARDATAAEAAEKSAERKQ